MSKPVLMAVDDDPGSLGTLDAALRGRYGRDYVVIAEATPATALDGPRQRRAAGLAQLCG
jgi:hypothetical protein